MPQESLQMQMNNRPLTIRKSDNHHFPLVVGNSQVLSRNQYIEHCHIHNIPHTYYFISTNVWNRWKVRGSVQLELNPEDEGLLKRLFYGLLKLLAREGHYFENKFLLSELVFRYWDILECFEKFQIESIFQRKIVSLKFPHQLWSDLRKWCPDWELLHQNFLTMSIFTTEIN